MPSMQYIKFPNGRVWRVSADRQVDCVAVIPNVLNQDGDDLLDVISLYVTGTSWGLTEFQIEPLGNDLIHVTGSVSEMFSNDPDSLVTLKGNSEALWDALSAQYRWSDGELAHALAVDHTDYGPESVLYQTNGLAVCCPAYPESCQYVRITHDGWELAYWIVDEWQQAPEEVMGAILGAAKKEVYPEPGTPAELSQEALLQQAGWTLECESPFEIRHADGSFASGQAAHLVLASLTRQS